MAILESDLSESSNLVAFKDSTLFFPKRFEPKLLYWAPIKIYNSPFRYLAFICHILPLKVICIFKGNIFYVSSMDNLLCFVEQYFSI